MNRGPSQKGVALVITLIMLAVVTLMAVVFLGISRRERVSVRVTSDQTDARLMAAAGSARAQADWIGRLTVAGNLFDYDYRVSTNYVNPLGFRRGVADFTNVNYFYASGQPLFEADNLRNLNNLFYDPRPPVFISEFDNNGVLVTNEFRFMLDLNRNGKYEPSGLVPLRNQGGGFVDTNGNATANPMQAALTTVSGDPEWIGVLEHPDQPHSPSNRFVGRFAYVIVPSGKTLDLNFIHNHTKTPVGVINDTDGYWRNQGVGSWELNLGAFFHELNTNIWNYSYSINRGTTSPTLGMRDAAAVLDFRYNNNYGNLLSVAALFGTGGQNAFRTDFVDGYTDGDIVLGTAPPTTDNDMPTLPWAGSDNPNGFSDPQELITSRTGPPGIQNLVSRLTAAGNISQGTYDDYTFYRYLAQLGTDSQPAFENRIHINYDNRSPVLATNFNAWPPTVFFTNAAERLMRREFNLGVRDLRLWPTNLYNARVHRVLQLAANIFDASTNRAVAGYPGDLPSVFRPRYRVENGREIFIDSYVEVTNLQFLSRRWWDMRALTNTPTALNPDDNIHGVPFVIGARKGYPNFNEFELRTAVQMSRKLEIRKQSLNARPFATNQMYVVGISNNFGVEAWNAYTQAYSRPLELRVTNRFSMSLTNTNGIVLREFETELGTTTTIAADNWEGMQFRVPMDTNFIFVPDSVYRFGASPVQERLDPLNLLVTGDPRFEPGPPYRVPHIGYAITNRLTYMLIDRSLNRLVDYVSMDNLVAGMDITRELFGNTSTLTGEPSVLGSMWDTNRVGNVFSMLVPTIGMINQIQASMGFLPLSTAEWRSYNNQPDTGLDREKAIDLFLVFNGFTPQFFQNFGVQYQRLLGRRLIMQAPFSPVRKLVQTVTWQANDPLVHYTFQDLYDQRLTNNVRFAVPPQSIPTNSNLGLLNERYRPWLGNPNKTEIPGDPRRQDSLVYQADDWRFPSNRFPNIGWLGRVHRGTPWQTIYLKSGSLSGDEWTDWSGSAGTEPQADRKFLDLFTTAANENAASGLLSVNQSGMAAWSAVLSGVPVLTNTVPNGILSRFIEPMYGSWIIEPGTAQFREIVTSINQTRGGGRWGRMGEVLSSPGLSLESPYLNRDPNQRQYAIDDLAYERIPQQILSLLKEDEPKVTIYSFGQSLSPAENSIVRRPGTYFQMVTNYQITGEVVTKTTVRLEGGVDNLESVVESYRILPAD